MQVGSGCQIHFSEMKSLDLFTLFSSLTFTSEYSLMATYSTALGIINEDILGMFSLCLEKTSVRKKILFFLEFFFYLFNYNEKTVKQGGQNFRTILENYTYLFQGVPHCCLFYAPGSFPTGRASLSPVHCQL